MSETVILATDAYTDRLVDPLRRTLIPVPSFQVATEPIPEKLRQTILPEGQSASDTWHLLRYFRLDATGRLVMGSRGTFADVPVAVAAGIITAPCARYFRSSRVFATNTIGVGSWA